MQLQEAPDDPNTSLESFRITNQQADKLKLLRQQQLKDVYGIGEQEENIEKEYQLYCCDCLLQCLQPIIQKHANKGWFFASLYEPGEGVQFCIIMIIHFILLSTFCIISYLIQPIHQFMLNNYILLAIVIILSVISGFYCIIYVVDKQNSRLNFIMMTGFTICQFYIIMLCTSFIAQQNYGYIAILSTVIILTILLFIFGYFYYTCQLIVTYLQYQQRCIKIHFIGSIVLFIIIFSSVLLSCIMKEVFNNNLFAYLFLMIFLYVTGVTIKMKLCFQWSEIKKPQLLSSQFREFDTDRRFAIKVLGYLLIKLIIVAIFCAITFYVDGFYKFFYQYFDVLLTIYWSVYFLIYGILCIQCFVRRQFVKQDFFKIFALIRIAIFTILQIYFLTYFYSRIIRSEYIITGIVTIMLLYASFSYGFISLQTIYYKYLLVFIGVIDILASIIVFLRTWIEFKIWINIFAFLVFFLYGILEIYILKQIEIIR